MIKALFSEINEELRLPMKFGELDLKTDDIEKAHGLAKMTSGMLKDIRGREVSYMLEKDGMIIAKVDLPKEYTMRISKKYAVGAEHEDGNGKFKVLSRFKDTGGAYLVVKYGDNEPIIKRELDVSNAIYRFQNRG